MRQERAHAVAVPARSPIVVDLAAVRAASGSQSPACIVAIAALLQPRTVLLDLVALTNGDGAVVYAGVFAAGRWREAVRRTS